MYVILFLLQEWPSPTRSTCDSKCYRDQSLARSNSLHFCRDTFRTRHATHVLPHLWAQMPICISSRSCMYHGCNISRRVFNSPVSGFEMHTLQNEMKFNIVQWQGIMIVMWSVSCRQCHNITKLFWVTIEGYLSYLQPKFEDLVPTSLGSGAI